ncbi:hypothetical protein NDU88_008171 [Pleurodeles waltl]|uniref:Uncharacterized protein n=1 Tax=Pleurodeles waltl TaxID=8319 RepID=A0AAV7QTS7_PLEWA|nr:hypothetical protein NDU88_008171 [Pleurodeles waltl]
MRSSFVRLPPPRLLLSFGKMSALQRCRSPLPPGRVPLVFRTLFFLVGFRFLVPASLPAPRKRMCGEEQEKYRSVVGVPCSASWATAKFVRPPASSSSLLQEDVRSPTMPLSSPSWSRASRLRDAGVSYLLGSTVPLPGPCVTAVRDS